MPRVLQTFSEIQAAVHLRFEGKSFLETAKILTEQNISDLIEQKVIHKHTFKRLNKINHKRVQGETNATIIGRMHDNLLPSIIKRANLKDRVVSPARLQKNSKKSQEWQDYEKAYRQAQNEKLARQAVK